MAGSAKDTPNGHLQRSSTKASRHELKRARPRRRANPLTLRSIASGSQFGAGRSTSPSGADTQGPLPVDLSLELEVKFPEDMVLKMKTLHECLKLHLPVSFISATLLTRGYFLILFENEEGVIATRKLTSVEWSELSLSFSMYTPGFDASAQGAETLLTHTIKVQFPNLHEQFRNVRALTIMANKLGEVLDIEAADSYVKRPTGPMVTIEIKDITKLAGYIRIPSMAEGASTTDTIRKRILYSGLPN
ncbi:unnamed protein product [Sphagnum troendelagicum]